MQQSLRRIQDFLNARGFSIQIISQEVQMDHIVRVAAVLRDVLQQKSAYVIDVTGGDERLMIAVGMVLAELDAPTHSKGVLQKLDQSGGASRWL